MKKNKPAPLKTRFLILAALVALTTSACLANKAQKGTAIGAAGGALAGQVIGRSTSATLIGLAAGAVLGYMYGNEMDKADKARLNQVYETSPSNRTTAWTNPDTGNSYQVTPKPAYKDNQGRDCREAEVVAVIDGKEEKVVSTACRVDGRWVLQ